MINILLTVYLFVVYILFICLWTYIYKRYRNRSREIYNSLDFISMNTIIKRNSVECAYLFLISLLSFIVIGNLFIVISYYLNIDIPLWIFS